MTALDMAMLLLAGGMAVTGFLRGFVQEVLSLLAWVLAIFAVRLFLAPVTDLAGLWLGPDGAASLAAFAGLFLVTFFIGKLLARRIGERTRTSILGPVDRVLGGGFGVVKGLVVATVLFLGFSLVYNLVMGSEARRPQWMESARSFPLLKASGDAMSQFIEDHNHLREAADNALDAAAE
jgi:membrane protein required for colicin V production